MGTRAPGPRPDERLPSARRAGERVGRPPGGDWTRHHKEGREGGGSGQALVVADEEAARVGCGGHVERTGRAEQGLTACRPAGGSLAVSGGSVAVNNEGICQPRL